MLCKCGKRMSGHLSLPRVGIVCGACFQRAMLDPAVLPPVVSEGLAKAEALDNATSREARIRLYQALYGMGRELFTGELLPKRHKKLDRPRVAQLPPPMILVKGTP